MPAPESNAFVLGRPRWWQWLTILSLDAPSVAVLWQGLLAQVGGVPIGWHHFAILGISVWLAYAADRWIEGWRLAPDQIRTQRHYFYQQWRWPICALWIAALVADIVIALTHLVPREFEAGFSLLLPVLAYLLSHQLVHRLSRWRAPKEICVALLFGGGVSVFLFAHPDVDARTLVEPVILFSLLCFANCALIGSWERSVDEAHGQTSLVLQFQRARAFSCVLPWVIAAVALWHLQGSGGALATAYGCVTASGLLLGALDLAEPRLGPQVARALVDIALMTPVVVMLT